MTNTYTKKSTNIPWFENIPSRWEEKRLKWLFSSIQSGAREQVDIKDQDGVANIGGEHIGKDGRIILKGMRYISHDFYKKMQSGVIKEGDLLLVKDGATIGKLAYVKQKPYTECSVNEHVYTMRTNLSYDTKYVYYLLRSLPIQEQIWINVRGSAQPGLNTGFVNRISIATCSTAEQEQIARYLDHKNHLINKYNRIKKRQIELLKEIQQVIINNAVTGKIDVRTGKPYSKYKDSGIDWLGMIPDEWNTCRLKSIVRMKSGESITSQSISENGTYQVYGGNGFRGYTHSFTHDGEYILVGRQGALCGNIHLVKGKFWASEHALVTSVSKVVQIKWLSFLLEFMNLGQYSEAAAQPGISVEKIMKLKIPIPELSVQDDIASFIASISRRIHDIISRHEKSIVLSQELQTQLTTAVVTGKCDVRNAKIPSYVEDLQEPDEIIEETEEQEDVD